MKKKTGRHPNPQKKVRVSVSLDPQVVEWVRRQAARYGHDQSSFIGWQMSMLSKGEKPGLELIEKEDEDLSYKAAGE